MTEEFIVIEVPKLAFAKDLREVQKTELDLWKQWNENGRQVDDMRPLLQSFKPMIRKSANKWVASRDVDMPKEAIYAEFNKQFVNAMKTFDPDKGKLGSWVGTNMRKADRWLLTYRNPSRFQGNRASKIGNYDRAKAELYEEYGREPTTLEIADYMKESVPEIQRLEAERRKAFSSQEFQYEPHVIEPSLDEEALRLAQYEFTPDEQIVADYTLGINGKPQLKPMQIAAATGMSPTKISNTRKAIANKIEKYLR